MFNDLKSPPPPEKLKKSYKNKLKLYFLSFKLYFLQRTAVQCVGVKCLYQAVQLIQQCICSLWKVKYIRQVLIEFGDTQISSTSFDASRLKLSFSISYFEGFCLRLLFTLYLQAKEVSNYEKKCVLLNEKKNIKLEEIID